MDRGSEQDDSELAHAVDLARGSVPDGEWAVAGCVGVAEPGSIGS